MVRLNPVRGKRWKEEETVGIFVDGPNMLRKEFVMDLRDLKRRAQKYGRVTLMKVFLNQFAPEKLVEAVLNEGFECIMVLGEEEDTDVDVALAVSVMESVLTKHLSVVVLASRDADFVPLVHKIKEFGKKVVVIGTETGFSSGLRNSADYVEYV